MLSEVQVKNFCLYRVLLQENALKHCSLIHCIPAVLVEDSYLLEVLNRYDQLKY